jgi:hypothetical protein
VSASPQSSGRLATPQAGRDLLIEVGQVDGLDRGPHLLGHQPRLLFAGIWEQDEELLAAVAADEVTLPQ